VLHSGLWYGSIALEIFLLFQLLRWRLASFYPALTAYLALGVVRALTLAWFRQKALLSLYAWTYFLTQPLIWIVSLLLVMELFSRTLEEYPGIRRLGRMVVYAGLAFLAAASGILIVLDRQAGFDRYPALSHMAVGHRSVHLVLSAVCLLMLLFFSHYRLSVALNVWTLFAGFGGVFVIETVLFALRRFLGEQFRPVRDLAGAAVFFFCILGVTLFFKPAGEVEKRPFPDLRGVPDPDTQQALASQLQSFNQTLLRVLKR